MNYLAIIVMFWDLSKRYAKKYADKLLGEVALGFNWKGAVNYVSDLPSSAAKGDAYTVKYTGSSGIEVLGSQFAWDGSAWIEVVTRGEKGKTGDPGSPGEKGTPGNDGFSPSAKVTKSGNAVTISITDKDGETSETITDGKDGTDGKKGDPGNDGFSPSAKVTKSDGIITISIVDKDGESSETVTDGKDGKDGELNVIENIQVNNKDLQVTNKTVNIDLSEYVIKEKGKNLAADSDIEQISTNKKAIEVLNGSGEGSVSKKIADEFSKKTYLTKTIATTEQITAFIKDPSSASFNVIYLHKDDSSAGPDCYQEYQRIGNDTNSVFTMTGDTSTDLSDYAKSDKVYSKENADATFVKQVTGKGLSSNDYDAASVAAVKTIPDKINKAPDCTAGHTAVFKADGSIEDGGTAPLSIQISNMAISIK